MELFWTISYFQLFSCFVSLAILIFYNTVRSTIIHVQSQSTSSQRVIIYFSYLLIYKTASTLLTLLHSFLPAFSLHFTFPATSITIYYSHIFVSNFMNSTFICNFKFTTQCNIPVALILWVHLKLKRHHCIYNTELGHNRGTNNFSYIFPFYLIPFSRSVLLYIFTVIFVE